MGSKIEAIEAAVEKLGKVWIDEDVELQHVRVYRGDEYVAITPDEVILDGKTLEAGRIEAGGIRRRGGRCAEVRDALRAAGRAERLQGL